MANTTERPTVPRIISVRLSDADLDLAADLVEWTGITEGTQLMRFALRSAHREVSKMVDAKKTKTVKSRVEPSHTPVDSDG